MVLYKTMVNYEKTTSMYIYGQLFTKLEGNSKEGSALGDMTAYKNLDDRNNCEVQKGTVYIQNCTASCMCQWNVDLFLVSHNEQKLPCTIVITQRHSWNILQWYSLQQC